MIDGTEAAAGGRPEPPTDLMAIPAAEVAVTDPTAPIVTPEAEPTTAFDAPSEPTTTLIRGPEPQPQPLQPEPLQPEPLQPAPLQPGPRPEPRLGPREEQSEPSGERREAATTGSVWPGLTAAGLPTRVPLKGTDDESIKEAFFQSWEATPTSPTPLTRAPFTPTYLGEPPRPRSAWDDELSPLMSQPPDPKEPPDPAQPPEPSEPPEPKEPPPPPAPPGPTPFPSPVPVPPAPVPPAPIPPGPPVPTPPAPTPTPPIPPGPPVPAPPSPFPPPPGPVPPPPAIVPGAVAPAIVPGRPPVSTPGRSPAAVPGRPGASVYQGGNYTELATEPITGMSGPGTATRESAVDRSGSLTGHLLSREMRERREKRRRLKTVAWVVSLLVLFGAFLATVVVLLAGDFIGGLFDTFARWAG